MKGTGVKARPASLQGQMERIFATRIPEYQQQLQTTTTFEGLSVLQQQRLMWDVDKIIEFCQSVDYSLRRKPYKNLYQSCQTVISHLNALDSEFEDVDENALMEVKDTNHFNKRLTRIYQSDISSTTPTSPTTAEQKVSIEASEKSNNNPQSLEKETPSQQTGEEKRSSKRKARSHESKRAKLSTEEKWPCPTNRLSDLGGIETIAEDVMQLLGVPLRHPEIYQHLGIDPPRGILLHGPPGCGKTVLAHAIAGEIGVPFINISAPSVVSGMSGESEKKIREVFDEAKELAPCILFIDEIDAITPKRETAQREMERRIVAQLLTCMDDVSPEKTDGKPVMIIGATNRPDSLDPALRRAGRFDREISVGVPDEGARARILEKICEKLKLSDDVDFVQLAKLTPGYVGADLNALISEAGMIAMRRIFADISTKFIPPFASVEQANDDDEAATTCAGMELDEDHEKQQMNPSSLSSQETGEDKVFSRFISLKRPRLTDQDLEGVAISVSDFAEAVKIVQPSSRREGFATVPDVTWDDIGALEAVRDELRMALVEPIKYPELFSEVGITNPMGVLLYGPPGCGKTLLAKAVANESLCNFISVKGPELLNKYVGESERALRVVFSRAQASSPCIIFFDELDAICPVRSNDGDNLSSSRLVNTLLTEMDGMQSRKKVYVIAATNRPDMIDPAMLRPGRLDKTLYVDLPSPQERLEILNTLTRKTPLDPEVDLKEVAFSKTCEGYSGADLASLVREAAVSALRSTVYKARVMGDSSSSSSSRNKHSVQVSMRDFETAFSKVNPSISTKDRRKYELLRVKFGSAADSQPVPHASSSSS